MKTVQIIHEGPGGELDRRTVKTTLKGEDLDSAEIATAIANEIAELGPFAVGDTIRIVEV